MGEIEFGFDLWGGESYIRFQSDERFRVAGRRV